MTRAPKIALAVTGAVVTTFLGYVLGVVALWWVGGYWEAQHAGGLAMAIVVFAVNGLFWSSPR